MDIGEVAKRAEDLIRSDKLNLNRLEVLALIGVFNGIAEGRIIVGQEFIGSLLLRRVDNTRLGLTKEQEQTFSDIFASGIATEGLPLGSKEQSKWTAQV